MLALVFSTRYNRSMAEITSSPYHRPDFTLYTAASTAMTAEEQLRMSAFMQADVLDGSVRLNEANPLELQTGHCRALFLGMVGLTFAEMTAYTQVPEKTHGSQRSGLYRKLHCKNMAQAVANAFDGTALLVCRPIQAVRELSDDQLAILRMSAQGLENTEVAQLLNTDPERVRRKIDDMFGRLSVTRMASAVLVSHMARFI